MFLIKYSFIIDISILSGLAAFTSAEYIKKMIAQQWFIRRMRALDSQNLDARVRSKW